MNGAVVWSAKYSSFGKANVEIETIENNLRFPGQYYDVETGLHYNCFRYYDPSIGKYIRIDPIGMTGGINLYLYCVANPINWMDVLGRKIVFDSNYRSRFPQAAELIENLKVSEIEIAAYRKHAKVVSQEVTEAFYSSYIQVNVSVCKGDGISFYDESTRTIYFDEDVLEWLDRFDAEGAEAYIEAKFKHEMVHWLDYNADEKFEGTWPIDPKCQGVYWEEEVYGQFINSLDDAIKYVGR